MPAVTPCQIQKDRDVRVPDFVILTMSARAFWPNAGDLEAIYSLDRHQDCRRTRCLHLLHFYPDLEVTVFSKTLVLTTRLQSVISKQTVTLTSIEASVTELLIHAFGIPTASPVLSMDRLCKRLEVHTHTVRDSDVVKNTVSLND